MRHAPRIGVVCRLLALAAVACVVGCTRVVNGEPRSAPRRTPRRRPADEADRRLPTTPRGRRNRRRDHRSCRGRRLEAETPRLLRTPSPQSPATPKPARPPSPSSRNTPPACPACCSARPTRSFAKSAWATCCRRSSCRNSAGMRRTLESLAGAKATVVLFWTADRWMSATALRDLCATPRRLSTRTRSPSSASS